MNAPKPQGFSSVVSISDAAKAEKNYSIMEIVTPFDSDDDEQSYKWTEIREPLGVSSNVANARWLPEKLMPLFETLRAPELLTDKGRPTKFCAQMLFRYNTFCNQQEKSYEAFCSAVRKRFPPKAEEVVIPDILDDDEQPVTNYETSRNTPSSSALARYQEDVQDFSEDLEGRFLRLKQLSSEVENLETALEKIEEKDWETQIIEEELAKEEERLNRKKKELELRLKARKMARS